MTATIAAATDTPPPAPVERSPRYPGAPPFRDSPIDRLLFRGRDAEAETIFHRILSHDLLLVYALSGTGKTSLLRAGVLGRLRTRRLFPVMVRLNQPDRGLAVVVREHVDLAVAEASAEGISLIDAPYASGTSATRTLWDELNSFEIWAGTTLLEPVLIFDQFEEIFTLWDERQRAALMEELGEVVRGHRSTARSMDAPEVLRDLTPAVKTVISMREDFLGQLELIAAEIPQILHHRFRLAPLTADQAFDAIVAPAQLQHEALASPPFTYAPDATALIVGFLATKASGRRTEATAVEPTQLQIICNHIEQTVVPAKYPDPTAPGTRVVTAEDLGGEEGLERVLTEFYRHQLELLDPATRRHVRELCETGLINDGGRRMSLEHDYVVRQFGLPDAVLGQLVSGRLLRAEARLDSTYYELSHDTLVDPILAYRTEQHELRRRATRRRITIASVVLLLVAAAVIAVLIARSGSGDEQSAPLGLDSAAVTGTIADGEGVPYLIDVAADGALTVVVEPDDRLDVRLRLTDASGADLTTVDSAGEGGTERVVVSGSQAAGHPRVFVEGLTFRSAGSFTVSTAATESIEVPIDSGWGYRSTEPDSDNAFEFTLAAGENADVTATATAFNPFGTEPVTIRVVDPSGRVIPDVASYDPNSEVVSHVIVSDADARAGRYRILVDATRSDQLELALRVFTPTALQLDVPTTARIGSDGSETFTLAESGLLLVSVTTGDADLDLVIDSLAGGFPIHTDDDDDGGGESVVLDARPSAGGTESFDVTSYNGNDGSFEVLVTRASGAPIEPGESVTVAADEADDAGRYEVSAPAGEARRLTASTTSESGVQIEVWREADGTYLGSFTATDPTAVVLQAPSATTYLVAVTPSPDADASLSIDAVDVQSLDVGDERSGDGDAAFALDVKAGAAATVTVGGANDVRVVDETGRPTFIGSDGEGGWSGVITAPTKPVRHYVTISQVDPGGFTISVEPTDPTEIAPGDRLRVRAEDTEATLVRIRRDPEAVLLAAVDPEPKLLPQVTVPSWSTAITNEIDAQTPGSYGPGNSQLVVVGPGEGGAVDVVVSPDAAASGAYDLTLVALRPQRVSPDDSVDPTLEAGESAMFEISADSTVFATVTVTGDLRAQVFVVSPDQQSSTFVDAFSSTSPLSITAPTDDRRSYVVVHSEAGTSGTIEISFSDR